MKINFGFNLLLIAFAIISQTFTQTIDSTTAVNVTDIEPNDESLITNTSSPEIATNEKDKTDENLKKSYDINNKKAFVDEKSLKLFRWTKERDFRFPIRPPKLRKSNTTDNGMQRNRIGYASALQTRETNLNSTQFMAPIRKVKKVKRKRLSSPHNQTNFDVFELQSSDQSPAIAIFVPKRLSSKNRLTGQIVLGTGQVINAFNNTRKRIPKLLLPKALRPAMYSLDGFVPRPSINRITSTEAPTTEKQIKYSERRQKKLKHINKIRRFGANRIEDKSSDKKDDIDVSDSRRRHVVTKQRKSTQSLSTSDSIPKPTVNKITKDKQRKGLAGKDYPTLSSVPKTGFDCNDLNNGVYADVETGCQVWHICQNKQKHSFLCPNGTIFSEKNGICDWWYNYDCPKLVKLTDKDDSDMDSIKEKLSQKRAKTKRSHRFA